MPADRLDGGSLFSNLLIRPRQKVWATPPRRVHTRTVQHTVVVVNSVGGGGRGAYRNRHHRRRRPKRSSRSARAYTHTPPNTYNTHTHTHRQRWRRQRQQHPRPPERPPAAHKTDDAADAVQYHSHPLSQSVYVARLRCAKYARSPCSRTHSLARSPRNLGARTHLPRLGRR